MGTEANSESGMSSVAQALSKAISELCEADDKRIYAVMDGSQFENLPRLLKNADVAHRPLYRYAGGDYSVILGGPWLIDPYHASVPPTSLEPMSDGDDGDVSDEVLAERSAALTEMMVEWLKSGDATGGGMLPGMVADPSVVVARLRAMIALSDGKPALVFWSGDNKLDAETLYRHLRGLNTIRVPKSDRDDGNPQMQGAGDLRDIAVAAEEDVTSDRLSVPGYERLIFRHADANVLMQVIPVLDEAQVATLFGPAEQIIFAPDSAWGGGLKRARKGTDVPPQSVLSLTRKNIEAMSDIRLEASRRKRVSLFRNSTPHLLDGLNDEQALICMERYEQQARAHGLRTERGFYQWTYLMSASEGRFIQSPEIRDHLKGGNPDKRLDEMMGFMANAAANGERA